MLFKQEEAEADPEGVLRCDSTVVTILCHKLQTYTFFH